MPTGPQPPVESLAAADDPRLDDEFWRALPAEGSREPVLLVGVVHGHPASSYRVRAGVEALDPDVVALELPSVAVPAFERAAHDRKGGSAPGVGEMCAAIDAAPAAEAVGIDTLGPGFFRRLVGNAVAERVSASTVRRTARNVVHVLRDAVAHRRGRAPGGRPASLADPALQGGSPAEQAAHERRQLSRSRSLLGAIERPRADRLLDDTREGTMAANVDDLRRNGSVVAVVGMAHLDSVASRLG